MGAIGVRKRKDAWQPSPGTARYPAIEARDAREGRSADQIIILEVETHLCGVVNADVKPPRTRVFRIPPATRRSAVAPRTSVRVRGSRRAPRAHQGRRATGAPATCAADTGGRRRACDVAVGTLREAHLEGTRAHPSTAKSPEKKPKVSHELKEWRPASRGRWKASGSAISVLTRGRGRRLCALLVHVRASRGRCVEAYGRARGTTTSFSAGKTFSSAEGRLQRIERRITQERRVKSTHPKIPSIRYVLFTSRDVPEWRETRRSFWNVSATWFRLGRFEDRRSNSGCDRWRSVKIPEAFRVFEAPRDLSDWAGIQSRLRPARALASGWVGSSWRTGAVRKKWENCIGARPSANNTARAEVVGGAR